MNEHRSNPGRDEMRKQKKKTKEEGKRVGEGD